ncbi:MAG TPA: hypothetical protein VK892_04475 [Pyrinomonadaceae bacterium]|nr:hypothetical protein [Pyrinomonadaceae bacterium]
MDGNNNENSTFEMETKENFNKILQAINEMRQDVSQRLEKIETEQVEIRKEQIELRKQQAETKKEFQDFKNYVEAQFEAIRQGLVKNYNQFDRLESQIAENRMVIFSTKAMLGELNERVYLLTRSTEQALK